MNFASISFFIFLGIVYTSYRFLNLRCQNLLLLGASYYFYGSWDWRFLGLIWFSTIVDFAVGHKIDSTDNPKHRKTFLLISLATNLGLLAVFKYFNFFSDSLISTLTSLGIQTDARALSIVLPVGISFYTFQTLSYTIDIYRGKLEPVKNIWDFALFVAFFPQLVAGPIERASTFIPQVCHKRQITLEQTSRGCFLILFGLFKKLAIANGVATSVNVIYNSSGTVGTLDIIAATYLFAIQIYCDFSGYSDIARGVSKLFGFDLMVNFNAPYFAVNPSDFWRRWHISLSTWLRDYLYIPLGGNRNGIQKTYRNLMLTMVLGGLWHGAAWNFIYWGIYQGSILCIHRLVAGAKPVIRSDNSLQDRIKRILITVIFFQVTAYGWMLFRASSWQQIYQFTTSVFVKPVLTAPTIPVPSLAALIGIVVLFVIDITEYITRNTKFYLNWPVPMKSALYATLTLVALMGLANNQATFIYFQF